MRVVNPYKVRLVTSGTTIEDKQIVIPVGETFDGIGQNQQVEDYVEKLADESVNPIVDYEKWRYIPLSGENSNVTTDLGYDFYFYDDGAKQQVENTTYSQSDSSASVNITSLFGCDSNGQFIFNNTTINPNTSKVDSINPDWNVHEWNYQYPDLATYPLNVNFSNTLLGNQLPNVFYDINYSIGNLIVFESDGDNPQANKWVNQTPNDLLEVRVYIGGSLQSNNQVNIVNNFSWVGNVNSKTPPRS